MLISWEINFLLVIYSDFCLFLFYSILFQAEEEAELAEEQKEEEPDRLTELLPQSKFSCSGKKTGYYADDGLNCEVFHYCQDNARHSWVCPEGFLFHQVIKKKKTN